MAVTADRRIITEAAAARGWVTVTDSERWSTWSRGQYSITVSWDESFTTVAALIEGGETTYAKSYARVYAWLTTLSPLTAGSATVRPSLAVKAQELRDRAETARRAAEEASLMPSPAPPIARPTVRFREMEF